ncbi:MAG: hypothetical protein FD174_1801 [Geobacteraceae bacterium]|nr:MAG: hypothetical protein FD174_1801 [Geobacteraceae bacterium]
MKRKKVYLASPLGFNPEHGTYLRFQWIIIV